MKTLPLCLLLAFTSTARTAEQSQAPITVGQRVATCGHSFHIFSCRQIEEMARAAGLQHRLVGISRIGGSTIQRHWDVPEEKSEAKKALIAGNADVLTLSPIWLPDDAIEKFARLGLEHNPALRVTVQEFWMPNDEYEPVYPLQTRKKVDHDATDLAKLRDATARYAKDIEDYVRSLNQRLGRNAVLIVPAGLAAVTLREKIVKGEAPGLKKQSELFRDNWGHAQPPLQILASYCHYAVIYRRSPEGLPVPGTFRLLKDMTDTDKIALNKLLQEIAWQTVTSHPMSGVRKSAASQ